MKTTRMLPCYLDMAMLSFALVMLNGRHKPFKILRNLIWTSIKALCCVICLGSARTRGRQPLPGCHGAHRSKQCVRRIQNDHYYHELATCLHSSTVYALNAPILQFYISIINIIDAKIAFHCLPLSMGSTDKTITVCRILSNKPLEC